jgi:hypothetical protein
MTTADVLARLYNWVLYLYPRAFYRRFAPEMAHTFATAILPRPSLARA